MSVTTVQNPLTAWRRWLGLMGWLALSFAPAATGVIFMPGSWYAALAKPAWNPPGWVFGPVWSTLYTMMAVAAWLVWQRRDHADRRRALGLFVVQLVFNAAWTPLFFGLHLPGVAFVELVLLWGVLAATILTFWRISRSAAWLLMPYLAWASFAAVLNFTVWRLNA